MSSGNGSYSKAIAEVESPLLDQKMEMATEGLEPYYLEHLKTKVSKANALVISNYILSMRVETNLSDNHRRGVLTTLKLLSTFHKSKLFREMSREDILQYLDSLRKTEQDDPLHGWIGNYNHKLVCFLRFFKWLYYPEEEPSKRQKPSVIRDIPSLRRKEKSVYKPSDLWTAEDDEVFLKYCANKRDRCFHAMADDTSCRPHELLKLRIRDVVFKSTENSIYAEVVVNGKTGSRVIPLFNCIPYLKDWLDNHPQHANSTAFLFCALGKNFGRMLSRYAIYDVYAHLKEKVFPRLLYDIGVPDEDKEKIRALLKKPWNPYIQRHSALTEKAMILREHVLRQHAGWASGSKMPQVYLHFFGNESSQSLLEAYGVVQKEQHHIQKVKQCPNCSEPNMMEAKFCHKCRMILSFDAYSDAIKERNERDSELQGIKEEFARFRQEQSELASIMKNPKFVKLLQELD